MKWNLTVSAWKCTLAHVVDTDLSALHSRDWSECVLADSLRGASCLLLIALSMVVAGVYPPGQSQQPTIDHVTAVDAVSLVGSRSDVGASGIDVDSSSATQLQRISLTCGCGTGVSGNEGCFPQARTVPDNRETALSVNLPTSSPVAFWQGSGGPELVSCHAGFQILVARHRHASAVARTLLRRMAQAWGPHATPVSTSPDLLVLGVLLRQ